MNKGIKISFICFIIGCGCLVVSTADLISIGAGILNSLFHTALPDVFFNSLLFRTGLLMIGAVFLLIGGILHKKLDQKAEGEEHEKNME